ncbi:hypothetical protein JZU54_02420, partial [bacterium]|nr:hypothetical protein [bacterium]
GSSSCRLVGRAATVVTPPTMVDGLSSPLILDNYDTFLLDMWGVMHDGRAPYEGVLRAVRKLKESGKRLILLSNSSKRREDAERMLVELGFDPADFHDIVTSQAARIGTRSTTSSRSGAPPGGGRTCSSSGAATTTGGTASPRDGPRRPSRTPISSSRGGRSPSTTAPAPSSTRGTTRLCTGRSWRGA